MSEWLELLPIIARSINTTWCRGLPRGTTPYEVFYGRSHFWERSDNAEYVDMASDSDTASMRSLSATPEEFRPLAEAARAAEAARIAAETSRSAVEATVEAFPFAPEVPEAIVEGSASQNESDILSELDSDAVESQLDEQLNKEVPVDSALVQRVQLHKAEARRKLIECSATTNEVTFRLLEIATLHIPSKLRLTGESERMPVRIIKLRKWNRYELLCK